MSNVVELKRPRTSEEATDEVKRKYILVLLSSVYGGGDTWAAHIDAALLTTEQKKKLFRSTPADRESNGIPDTNAAPWTQLDSGKVPDFTENPLNDCIVYPDVYYDE
jgi:hypothetical protein